MNPNDNNPIDSPAPKVVKTDDDAAAANGNGGTGTGGNGGTGTGEGDDKKKEESLVEKLTSAIGKAGEAADALKKAGDNVSNIKSTAEEMKEMSEIKVDDAFVEKSANLVGTLNFEDIIGKPLKAAVNAQRNMADETLKYIKDKGIITTGEESRVATVSLSYMKGGKKVQMTIPLLSLIPIPNLGISEMTYDFKIVVDAASSVVTSVGNPPANTLLKANSDSKPAASGAAAGGAGGGAQTGGVAGGGQGAGAGASAAKQTTTNTTTDFAVSYSSKRDSSATRQSKYSVETTMDVKITAKQLDLPGGLQVMLDALANSAEEIDTNGALIIRPDTNVVLKGKNAAVVVSYRDGSGVYAPGDIKVTKLTDGGDTALLPTGDEMIVLFEKAGTYSVSAGKLQQVVFVSKGE